jgi:hypothetical protein
MAGGWPGLSFRDKNWRRRQGSEKHAPVPHTHSATLLMRFGSPIFLQLGFLVIQASLRAGLRKVLSDPGCWKTRIMLMRNPWVL